MRINGISGININNAGLSQRYNASPKAQPPSFGVGIKGDLGLVLCNQAFKNNAIQAYTKKAEEFSRLCSPKSQIFQSWMSDNRIGLNFKSPEISKAYEKPLGACMPGGELKLFLNLTPKTLIDAENSLVDIMKEKRSGVLLKAIHDTDFYDKLMSEYNPQSSDSVHAVVSNLEDDALVNLFYFNPKGNDKEISLSRKFLEERLDELAKTNPKFKDTVERQIIIQSFLSKL